MSYSSAFFGKEPNKLVYDDIANYFQTPQPESDKIEFKAYVSLGKNSPTEREDGIIRTLCAMLNSSGGIIIWGAPSQSESGAGDKFFGDLTPLPESIGKDRFQNRISDLITPTPHRIQMIELQGPTGYVYLFDVEQSPYSPHQYRNTYFMRIDGQTRAAPHHYIEALFRRVTYPNLEGYLKFDTRQPYGDSDPMLEITIMIFNLSKLQNEYDLGFRLIADPGMFPDREVSSATELILNGGGLRCSLAREILYYNEPFVRTVFLHLPYSQMRGSGNAIRFQLYFAGKQSPLKVSSYRLSTDIINNNIYIRNEHREENLLISEQGDQNLSEIQRVNVLLGRQ
ncbi:ATP-binding protein [Dyadobacter fanqingshengii]|uniref:ATP-binding protein n=1 Tax=Dyadobacter fanqingshengii TaxID=2906443 RepID=A0A9X1PGI0_9BACT|nr:ATP-binding protein [Dyadobacter fanqingshengii]MCF0043664.1 ATP-binding protein [Dyadobacter fanqingshengii]USJ34720.1 ATP-binding protein [Dyadobacter fanqingshengii]